MNVYLSQSKIGYYIIIQFIISGISAKNYWTLSFSVRWVVSCEIKIYVVQSLGAALPLSFFSLKKLRNCISWIIDLFVAGIIQINMKNRILSKSILLPNSKFQVNPKVIGLFDNLVFGIIIWSATRNTAGCATVCRLSHSVQTHTRTNMILSNIVK